MGKKSASKKRDKGQEKGLVEIHYDRKKKKDGEDKTNTEPLPKGESKTGEASNNGTDNLSDSAKGSQSSKSDSEHSKKLNASPKSKVKKEKKIEKNEEESKDEDDESIAEDSIVTISSRMNMTRR